ncbi:MAG: trehalose-phosphatase [Verrucomicrobiaceae bacterium]|nr:MAG: trehalose-phosphatase [Verrucomicrobiaceae bacterium]
MKAMTPPHWTERREELAARLGRVPRLLVATDFDGTLAPICSRPQDVAMPPGAKASLEALAKQPGVRVAVLSGRALAEVAGLVGLPKAVYAGNHGLEIKGGGIDWVHPQALACRPRLDAAVGFLEEKLQGTEGAFVEHKQLSLSLHYRLVADHDLPRVEEAAMLCAAAFPELRRHGGKKVVEFRPDVPWHKGYALKRLLKGLGLPTAAALYAGDDATDEDAFAVLGDSGITLHVGENPGTLARCRLRSPEDYAEFLEWLRRLRIP